MLTIEMMATDPHVFPERIRNRRVAVLGLARTGTAACRMLLAGGAQVLASDIRDDTRTRAEAESLRDLGAWVELGSHSEAALLEADFIVPSPGLKPTLPVLQRARERGIPVFSEIEVAFWLCRGDVLALTGTNGKTTTATLLHHMLATEGQQARLAGNVGLAFSAVAAQGSGPVVLEVSSYQLEFIETFKPTVAGLLNITPDHLDRHGDLETYTDLKYRLAENMGTGDSVVLNADCPLARKLPVPSGARSIFFSTQQFLPEGVFCEDGVLAYRVDGLDGELVSLDELRIPGRHNQANAAAAAAMALAYRVSPDRISAALRSFEGVPHRIELLGTKKERRVYNDSKATNVGAMQVALEAVDGPIVLLVGGRLKGDDPHTVDDLISAKVRAIIAYGEGREQFREAWHGLKTVEVVADLKAATGRAFAISQPGDAVLLSPACASFDQFDNFEQRGDRFREYVEDVAS